MKGIVSAFRKKYRIYYYSDSDHKIEHSLDEFKKEIGLTKLKLMKFLRSGARFGQVVMHDKDKELISVIIPCFNGGKLLVRSLNSVIKQTWCNKEIILVDDGSYDKETLQIIESFEIFRSQNYKAK